MFVKLTLTILALVLVSVASASAGARSRYDLAAPPPVALIEPRIAIMTTNPLDDSFDCPFGYGEYAEYGPWAARNTEDGCCAVIRRLRSPVGRRVLVVRNCR